MELQGEDGSVLELVESVPKELGRGPGIAPHDRTVSRRQVRLQLERIANNFRFRVSVEVIGPNPVCVVHSNGGGKGTTGEVEIAKPGTHCVLETGDKFSLSILEPVFYTLQEPVARVGIGAHRSGESETSRRNGDEDLDEEEGIAEAVARWQRRKHERLQGELERPITQDGEREQKAEDTVSEPEVVFSERDPAENTDDFELTDGPRTDHGDDADLIKRFGFVVEGSEFERYGKKRHDTSKWDWRIGKRSENDGDEDEDEEGGGLVSHYQTGNWSRVTAGSKVNQKAKRANDDDDDDDWRGDSEGEKELLVSGNRPVSRKKDVQTGSSHDLATSLGLRKKRKLASTSEHEVSDIKSKSLETGKTRVNSRQPTASTSTKKSTKPKPRAKEEDEEEDDEDDEGDLDGFLVDDVEEEGEYEVADDEDEWTDEDEDEEIEDEDEIDEERGKGSAQLAGQAPGPSRPAKDNEPDGDDDKPLCKYGNKCFRKNKDHLAEFRH